METNIQIFTSENFGEIRTCQVNNQIMFVGKDVATALGYSNSQKAIRDHVDDDDKLTERFVLSGQIRSVIIINESGLYSLILSSKLPQAKAFKRWVTISFEDMKKVRKGYDLAFGKWKVEKEVKMEVIKGSKKGSRRGRYQLTIHTSCTKCLTSPLTPNLTPTLTP